LFGGDQGLHRLLPGARGYAGIAAGEVGFGDLEVERWLAQRLRADVRRRGRVSLALSGGSSAPPMFEALLEQDRIKTEQQVVTLALVL
jgi:hypothetical protein